MMTVICLVMIGPTNLAGAKYVGKKVLAESEIKEFFN